MKSAGNINLRTSLSDKLNANKLNYYTKVKKQLYFDKPELYLNELSSDELMD